MFHSMKMQTVLRRLGPKALLLLILMEMKESLHLFCLGFCTQVHCSLVERGHLVKHKSHFYKSAQYDNARIYFSITLMCFTLNVSFHYSTSICSKIKFTLVYCSN